MAKNLISYFENLSRHTDKNSSPFERTGSSKLDKVKKLVNNFIEIKRPPHESKLDNNGLNGRSKTTGLRVSENEYDKTKQERRKEDEELRQTCASIFTKTTETGSDNKDVAIINRTSHGVSKIEKNIDESVKKWTKQQSKDVSSLGFQNQDEKSVEGNSQEEICDSYRSFDSDDLFGLNDFSEDCTDFYIVQTYNVYGRELIKTQIEIRSIALSSNGIENPKIEFLEYPDLVFNENTQQNDGALENLSQLVENSSKDEHLYYNVNFIKSSKEEDDDESNSFDSDIIYEEIDNFASYNPNKKETEDANAYNTTVLAEAKSSSFMHCLQSEQIQGDNLYHNPHDLLAHEDDDIFLENNHNVIKTKSEQKDQINYVINELIKTEELYISNLEAVVKKYLPHLYSRIGKSLHIFGNIEKIYEAANIFLELLKNCGQNADEIAKVFINCSHSFDLYPQYSKNKPTADLYLIEFDSIVKERQMELGDNLPLASYLLTPIQRLPRYKLLLEKIQKELNKTGQTLESVNSAVNIIRNVTQKSNDSIAIDSIKQCKIDLITQGPFIMRANFNILKPRKFTSMVFLFEEVIVFTEQVDKNLEQFNYVDSIQITDLGLVKFEDNLFVFHLIDYQKKQKPNHYVVTYILKAEDPKIKNDWTMAIEAKLWDQLQKAKGQQKQINLDEERGLSRVPLQRGSIIRRLPDKKEKPPKPKSKFYDDTGTLIKNAYNVFQNFTSQH